MLLTLSQAAERLGKTRRQIRYMIQQGALPARKDGGRWVVDAADLPLPEEGRAATARREARLRDAVDNALAPRPARRYSLRDLKAVGIGVPLHARCLAVLGAESGAVRELRAALDLLAVGYHRYGWSEKRNAYSTARDAAREPALREPERRQAR